MAKVDLKQVHKDELKEGVKKALINAQELFDEAEILFNNKKYARAFTLTQLCSEEIGKARMLTGLCWNIELGESIDYSTLNTSYTDHKDKSAASLFFELFGLQVFFKNKGGDGAEQKFEEVKKELLNEFYNTPNQNVLKNDSLYVGLSSTQLFVLPSELFSSKKTEDFMDKVKIRLAVASATLPSIINDSPTRQKAIELIKNGEVDLSEGNHSLEDLNFNTF